MTTLCFLLRNLFPYKGYKFCVLEAGERIRIGMISRRKSGTCPVCKKRCKDIESEYQRTVRDLNLGQRKCYLLFKEKKIRCSCGYRGVEELDFVTKSRRVTKRMEVYIVTLCKETTLKTTAQITGLDWKTIKEVDKKYIQSLLPDIHNLDIRRIAIDEIAIMKGHKYFTNIRDYDTGVVIKIVMGRCYSDVKNSLLELGQERLIKIQYASMDMWDPYIKAITEACPNAKIVFDKFHVIKKVNEAVDKVRKIEFSNADKEERKMMKHKRFIILKKEGNLKHKEKEELQAIMQNNDCLYKCYLLKEQIISIFDDKKSTFDHIQHRLNNWFENTRSNDEHGVFEPVVKMMQNYFYGILNYFRYGMTNAIAEGFNTKINIIKRRAYGFTDLEYFMLKIYQSSLERLA
jgi:transposase